MADAKAIIVLTPGHELHVQQSVDEIRALVSDAPRGDLSFTHVVDVNGKDHWINVREIVDFYEPPANGSAAL